jgi:large subunit ribosomal protein L5
MITEMQKKYEEQVRPALMKELQLKNPHQAPKLEKIVVSIGMGEAVLAPATMDKATEELKLIAGQMPIYTLAKKSIASFKLRQGMKIGLKVTLRGKRMYAFLERLVHVALPRVRDFRGVPANFDSHGNFNLGIREQIVFPEIDYDKVDRVRGLQVTFVTSAKDDASARALLTHLGVPFAKLD